MDSQKQQVSERVKQANNILVTVSTNPSVDQLAACIGLTLSLNKMGKHATAVFSGNVPSTIEFLQPEKTLEKNTDSLRDFIIALDKSKADKLRYKVEDRVVKIFITPYRTSINEKDLEFSQGDFNVDVVLALGVHNQADLDQAITSHGRILHDATVVTMNVRPGGELGSINWLDTNASSLSELAVQLVDSLDKKLMDGQIATAMLTGIVAETDRFSNGKTSPETMSISAELMALGANQQLVATKLEEPAPPPPPAPAPIATQQGESGEAKEAAASKKPDDGTLEIAHDDKPVSPPEPPAVEPAPEPPPHEPAQPSEESQIPPEAPHAEPPPPPSEPTLPPKPETPPAPPPPQIHIDEHGALSPAESDAGNEDNLVLPPKTSEPPAISHHSEPPKMVLEPPTMGGQLNAVPGAFNSTQDDEGTPVPGMPDHEVPLLGNSPNPAATPPAAPVAPTILPPSEEEPRNAPGTSFLGDQPLEEHNAKPPAPQPGETLSDIEKGVHSSHLNGENAAAAPEPPAAPFEPSPPPQFGQPPMMPPAPAAANDAMLPPAQVPVVAPDDLTPEEVANAFGPMPPVPAQPNLTEPANDQGSQPTSPLNGNTDLNTARDAVSQAINGSTTPALNPVEGLNALPLGSSQLQDSNGVSSPLAADAYTPPPPQAPPVQPWTPPLDSMQQADPNAPPPGPPPMMPQASP